MQMLIGFYVLASTIPFYYSDTRLIFFCCNHSPQKYSPKLCQCIKAGGNKHFIEAKVMPIRMKGYSPSKVELDSVAYIKSEIDIEVKSSHAKLKKRMKKTRI
ncbi:hypothetical protein TNCT_27851 [Trichonephila clavata]|uniref:Uncharacterized protein n=1 Tax=Trichonephila clavata TaxID=2740835 RepID=A0A8X6J9W0_TRICU|nr:hypothetical protein TNCT_27851 [Trichonephila clavata]